MINNNDGSIKQSNILVCVRNRPLSNKEKQISSFETVKVLSSTEVQLFDPQFEMVPDDYLRNNRRRDKAYAFDIVFDNNCTQNDVFSETSKPLLADLFKGYNSTVFAYGATGAGKTHTMIGNVGVEGVIPLTLQEIFEIKKEYESTHSITIKISFLEVYNEILKDLLSSEDELIDIREDVSGSITITGLNYITVSSKDEIMTILKIGNKNRSKEPTDANEVSSRSHAVFQLSVESTTNETKETTVAKLSLIDLAGSERAAYTNNKGIRMIEGANINKSLLALGNCINALSDINDKGIKINHIPYRDSKLTRLLKDSLNGNCRTVMIANVSPSIIHYEDTLNTLKYANRAKNIKTYANINVINNRAGSHYSSKIEEYNKMINELKAENLELKMKIKNNITGNAAGYTDSEKNVISEYENKIITHFDNEKRINLQIFALEDEIDSLKYGNINEDNSDAINILNNKLKGLMDNYDNIKSSNRSSFESVVNKYDSDSFINIYLSALLLKEISKIVSFKRKI